MKHKLSILLLAAAAVSCGAPSGDELTVRWDVTPGDQAWQHTLTVVNRGSEPLEGPWSLYYGTQSPALRTPAEAPLGQEQLHGTLHRFHTTEAYAPIAPGDSLQVTFTGAFYDKLSFFPEGMYFVGTAADGRETAPRDVAFTYNPYRNRKGMTRDAERLYGANARFADPAPLAFYDILPAMKSVRMTGAAACKLGTEVNVTAAAGAEREAELLKAALAAQCGCTFAEGGTPISLSLEAGFFGREEAYGINVSEEGIAIKAATTHGLFNAAQSLLCVLEGRTLPVELPAAEIADYPDFSYRGIHFDVARNFTEKENVLKLLDLFARYKIDVFHFHITDDEGWRLEIPGLEELTEVGGRRGHTDRAETEHLMPLYGSSWKVEDGAPGSGFYTRDDYIEILRYARDRHIRVIPEIDLPGHSRAAIKAMQARYARYIDTDPEKARQYLLVDSCDRSAYRSVQDFSDNVIDIGLATSYAFVEKIFDELQRMHADAGTPLEVIHIGGDEVPHGTWEGSPSSQAFMKEHGLKTAHDLKNYFVRWLYAKLAESNIRLAGWQEIVMMPDGRTIDKLVPGHDMFSYGWSTLPGNGADEIPYALANMGYPVVLCNVTNLYLDLSYSRHPLEPGLMWGGYVDAVKSFDMQPYDIYKSLRPADMASASKGKTALRPEARKNIVGMQAQLWAETIRSFDMVYYQFFPKMFGLVERAWNAEPAWAATDDEAPYAAALKQYYARISEVEMPFLAGLGAKFRLTPPGIKVADGKLFLMAAEQGAEVRYTTDGSEPTAASPLWTGPVACDAATVKARTFYCGLESVASEWYADAE